MSAILQVQDLSKTYPSGGKTISVLDNISFSLMAGDTFAIVGPSGSGKTTLLGLCAGLDNPSSGNVALCGKDMFSLNEDERAILRNQHTGFVFQNFQLLSTLTALENVMIPLELQGRSDARSIAKSLLKKVGLERRQKHYPSQLSGGEQQRVSIARAFSNEPSILFADEPTGNLDYETGQTIVELLFDLNREANTTLVIVTHDMDLAAKAQRILKLKNGSILSDQLTAVL